MGIRKRKPTSPGRRFQTVSDFADITKSTPERTLLGKKKNSAGGRNSYGRITSRHQGGGHKQQYRIIDFKRNTDTYEAKVAAIEYDPNRTCRIALLHYEDGSKSYILAPKGLEVGMRVHSGPKADIKVGNALPLRFMPVGTVVHNIELRPGQGGKVARSAGMAVQLVAKEGIYATLRMPSTEMRRVLIDCPDGGQIRGRDGEPARAAGDPRDLRSRQIDEQRGTAAGRIDGVDPTLVARAEHNPIAEKSDAVDCLAVAPPDLLG